MSAERPRRYAYLHQKTIFYREPVRRHSTGLLQQTTYTLERDTGACYNEAMIVDFHTHVFPPRMKEDRHRYAQADAGFARLYSSPRARMATADELVSRMDRDGVDVSVILNGGWATADFCAEVNDYILESVARYPRRLVGFCAPPLATGDVTSPQAREAAVREVERCVAGGARGVGELRPDTQMLQGPEAPDIRALVEVIRKHRLVLLVHTSEPVGHVYAGKGKATPDVVYSLITAYPDVRVVCAHWGGGLPFYALMPEVKEGLTNTYFDTAASPFLYTPQVYRAVADLVGAEKVLFGSDCPLLPQKRLLTEIASAGLSREEKELVLSGNASRLLGMGTG